MRRASWSCNQQWLKFDRRLFTALQEVSAPDNLIQAPYTQLCKQLADLPGHQSQEMNEELRCASKFSAQVFALRSNARGAGIQMALARHIATQCNQAGSAKAEFIGSQQSSDQDIAPGLQTAIDAHSHAPAQPIAYERLLRLSQPALPGYTGVLDRLKRRGARPPIMPADLDIISVCLCNTRGDCANANACNELDADIRPWVDLLQVIDQLSNVFDAVYIVMRRRRDQWHMW